MGLHSIRPKILKLASEEFYTSITIMMFNKSVSEGIPQNWKKTIVR